MRWEEKIILFLKTHPKSKGEVLTFVRTHFFPLSGRHVVVVVVVAAIAAITAAVGPVLWL